jgi:hypothetical protein
VFFFIFFRCSQETDLYFIIYLYIIATSWIYLYNIKIGYQKPGKGEPNRTTLVKNNIHESGSIFTRGFIVFLEPKSTKMLTE